MEVSSKPNKEKDFSMLLSELGEPDEGFAAWCAGKPGGFAKWTVQEPTGPRLSMNDIMSLYWFGYEVEAEVHFTGKMLDGTVFASSRENEAPLTLTLTRENVMEGFRLAIGSMNPGERAVFTIPTELTVTESGHTASIPWNIPLNQTLWFDIELISLVTDILDDQGIQKKIIKFGRGYDYEQPRDEVFVHFIGRMLDGTVFASTGENGSPLTLIPTQEDVMEGFSLAISSMQEGEKAMFTIPDKLSLTKSGYPASIPWNIPPNETLWFDIEVISFTTDILGDQGIMKKTTKLGAGEQHPCDLDEVFVNYNVWLKDGTLVSESEGVEFSLAEGFFCPAFAHALKTMNEGEEVFLVVKPQYGFGECGRPSMGNEIVVPPNSTLHVNLRLISWKTVMHIGKNGEIVKTTFSRAKFGGRHAREGDYIKVRLIGKLQDGTIFDRRGHDGQEPAVFSRDKETDCVEKFVDGLKEAVMTMVEGDIASVTIPPQHAFGTVGSNEYQLAVVPPDSLITYEIELLSVELQGRGQYCNFSRRKMKQDRERRERLMGVVPPAAKLQDNASPPPIPAAPAVVLVGGQSSATPETPAAGAGSVTTTSYISEARSGFSLAK